MVPKENVKKVLSALFIKKFITHEAAILACNALVGNHIDYCNSQFGSLSKSNIKTLWSVQQTLARIITNSLFCRISPAFKDRCWLLIKKHSMVYKYIRTGYPNYLNPTLLKYSVITTPSRNSDKKYLTVP